VIQHRDSNNMPVLTLTRGLDLSGGLQGAGSIGGLLAMTESSGASSYYHADGNGNVTALVSGSGVVVARYLYDPFGNTLAMSGPKALINTYRFSSKPIHDGMGWYDYLRRWYAPEMQRWPNRDPIGEAGGINLYGYVYNSPLNYIDPDGKAALPYIIGAGVVSGVIIGTAYYVQPEFNVSFNPQGALAAAYGPFRLYGPDLRSMPPGYQESVHYHECVHTHQNPFRSRTSREIEAYSKEAAWLAQQIANPLAFSPRYMDYLNRFPDVMFFLQNPDAM
jgi:RHS repeat-associated protein